MVLAPYAEYVWAAYGISFVALAITVVVTLTAWQRAKRLLASREKPVQLSETNI
jgi:heme exporter protein CcmD